MSTQQHDGGKPHKKRKIKHKPVLEQVPAVQQQQQQQDGNSKFARALGSTDYATREKGLQALSRFLVHKANMSELDMMKLWKGLFFCFWHSDKAPVQVCTSGFSAQLDVACLALALHAAAAAAAACSHTVSARTCTRCSVPVCSVMRWSTRVAQLSLYQCWVGMLAAACMSAVARVAAATAGQPDRVHCNKQSI